MFDFLRRIPGMLTRKKTPASAPAKASAAPSVEADETNGESPASEGGAAKKPRRPKSPSQRRSGPKPKSGGARPKRKK